MSIRRRGKYWIVDVGVGAERVRKHARTYEAAKAKEHELRQRIRERGGAPERGLEDALTRYLAGEARQLADERKQKQLARIIWPLIHGRTLSEAPAVADQMKRDWAHLKPATINRRLALLRRLCSLAFKWGWTVSPMHQRIPLLTERNERHVYLTPAQVERLAVECEPYGDLVRLLAYTGLRVNEALRLTAADVSGDLIVVPPRTKTGKPRNVPVPGKVRRILKRLPFQVTYYPFAKLFRDARRRARLNDVRIHDLRHTYASLLAASGASLRVVQELLGHATPQMTARYSHLYTDALRAAVRKI